MGAAEANSITVSTLVQPGDHVVVMQPGYQQVRGLAANLGADATTSRSVRRTTGGPTWTP